MFQIRDYRNEDHEQLVAMITSVLAEYGMSLDLGGPDKDLTNMQEAYFGGGGAFLVAEIDGSIIGSVGVGKVDDRTSRLRKLYVLRAHRGKGVGRMLIEKAIEHAVSYGYETLELEVSQKHRRAIRLYEKLGFKKSDTPSCCPRCEFIYARNLRET